MGEDILRALTLLHIRRTSQMGFQMPSYA